MFRQTLVRLQSIPKLAVTPNKYNSKSSAFNLKPDLPNGLFYHPSPSSLNPLITPKAFLPEEDVRKTSDLYFPEEKNLAKSIEHMPILYAPNKDAQRYHLTKEDIQKLQQLRNENKISRKELCDQFGISNYFFNIATTTTPERVVKFQKQVKEARKKWSKKKIQAKELSNKRAYLWFSNA